jgi:hypothetical protein
MIWNVSAFISSRNHFRHVGGRTIDRRPFLYLIIPNNLVHDLDIVTQVLRLKDGSQDGSHAFVRSAVQAGECVYPNNASTLAGQRPSYPRFSKESPHFTASGL